MIVFGPSASPYVRKVLAFASEKGIDVESRPGMGPTPDPEFLEASPFRKIPAFKDGDFSISDSSAIVAYLEKARTAPSLIPTEARAHARTVWFEEYADTILGEATVRMFFNRVIGPRMGRPVNPDVADKAEREELPRALHYLESVIPTSGFLVEDRLTLADVAVASPFVNLGHMGISADPATFPKTAAYVSAMLSRPSFAPLIEAEKAMFG